MIDELKKNIDTEIEILREISSYVRRAEFANEYEKRLLNAATESLKNTLKIVNDSIPVILREVKSIQVMHPLQDRTVLKQKKIEQITFKRADAKISVVLAASDRNKFLRELSISEGLVKRIKKHEHAEVEKYEEFKAARGYLKFANKLFLGRAQNMIKKGSFSTLSIELHKANLEILFESYIAMMLLTTCLSAVIGLFATVALVFVSVHSTWPFISLYQGEILARLPKIIWIPFVVPVATFFLLYIYPSTEKSALKKKIDQELPFVVIHMSAISGSGIEPSQIFRIVSMSKEYPNIRKEFRKVLNQINLYGYDLVNALNNAAKTSPSERLSEVFSGISTTITSGASLSEFFTKRAEGLLVTYRLEREKYTKVAETFMDIYISVVIAAPMILLLLLIIISIAGVTTGFSKDQIGLLVVVVVAILNIFFLIFLHLKQPVY
jgi:pilus assembly protein TadC